jgi:hypothetical protein
MSIQAGGVRSKQAGVVTDQIGDGCAKRRALRRAEWSSGVGDGHQLLCKHTICASMQALLIDHTIII